MSSGYLELKPRTEAEVREQQALRAEERAAHYDKLAAQTPLQSARLVLLNRAVEARHLAAVLRAYKPATLRKGAPQ